VELTVIPDQDTFTGTVEIDLRFEKSTALLWLNAEKLTVNETTLKAATEKVDAKIIAESKDYIGFAFPHPVGPGEATLRVSYKGEISRKDRRGIFQVKDGDHWYVYTQFEETSARQAFPCFDEPGYKVPWQLTLHVKQNHEALSNTPIASMSDVHDGMKTISLPRQSLFRAIW
jgi:alanyl aminopeptidase